jgi:hypothetical protein
MDMTLNETFEIWFGDLATSKLASGAMVEFTFFWRADQRWEGRNWQVTIQ